jgi:hypothetical protein
MNPSNLGMDINARATGSIPLAATVRRRSTEITYLP